MTDRRQSEEDNPFAPPPEGQPDQPWRPRYPQASGPHDDRRQAGAAGGGGQDPSRQDPSRQGADPSREEAPPRWGSQWSRRQPRRQPGGFGDPPPSPGDRDGSRQRGGRGGFGGRQRWDPTDPAQRHARYAVLAGMWGVFASLVGWDWLGLLLGALALYWGISALRGGPARAGRGRDEARRSRLVAQLEGRTPQGAAQDPAPQGPQPVPGATGPGQPPGGDRPQLGTAVAGVVLASAALLIVATTYTMQLVYKDYYDCVSDALTTPARESCEELLPSKIRPFLTEQG